MKIPCKGCGRFKTKGVPRGEYCSRCNSRKYNHNIPIDAPSMSNRTLEEAAKHILENSSFGENGCFLWKGCATEKGYGVIKFKNRFCQTHRIVFVWKAGVELSDLDGLALHHICRSRGCVNIEHLQPMTQNEHAKLHRKEKKLLKVILKDGKISSNLSSVQSS